MEVTIQVPDELLAEAQSRGLALEDYIREVLSRRPTPPPPNPSRPRTPEEIRAWLDSLAEFSDRIPPLPENITREWIYQDHD